MEFFFLKIKKSAGKIWLITGLIFLFACNNSDKKTEIQALEDLKSIENLIASDDFQKAKIAVDSFHVVYRKKIELRKKADILSDTIELRESRKIVQNLNDLLPAKLNRINELKTNFRLDKNNKYQDAGIYMHVSHDAVANADRDYIQAHFDENGLFYIVSNHTGKKIKHNQIEISFTDLSVSSGVISSGHYYTVEGQNFERLSVSDSIAANLAEFIVLNSNNKLKVKISGSGEMTYSMPLNDSKIITETYEFWKLKKETDQINKELTRAKKRIQIIELKKQ